MKEQLIFHNRSIPNASFNLLPDLGLKGELHSNYILLYIALIGLEWDSITLFTKKNVFLPKLTFQQHLRKIYVLLFTNMNIFQ